MPPKHAPAPKYSYDDVILHCTKFFDRSSDDWNYKDFTSYVTELGTLKFDVLNHRWMKALSVIESSPYETRARRKKARSLMDRCKNYSHQRRTGLRNSAEAAARHTIVHNLGDVIHHGGVKIGEVAGDFVATGGGAVSINKTSQKRNAQAAVAARPLRRRTRENPIDVDGEGPVRADWSVEADNIDPVIDDPPSSSSPFAPTPSPRYSPVPPFNEDPYSHFGEFPYPIEFVNTYLSMQPKTKRTLTTGKILEDTIFHHVRPIPANSQWLQGNPILRWILDFDDVEVKKWFTKEERIEIMSWGPPLPPRDPAFEYAVGRFPETPTSADELWDIIESKSRPADEPFVESRHCTAIYSNNAANSILAMIMSYSTCPWLGPQDLREGWFTGIWQPLIDRCLHCIPSLSVFRTEIKSSSSNSKFRFDAIFRAQLADAAVYELGCIEVARVTAATPAGKEEVDASKLVGGLYDMLGVLDRSVKGDEEVMKKVQVVGIQNIGFKMNVWTMHKLGQNVALMQKGQGRCVPIELKNFGKVIEVMRSVVRVKGIVERSIEAVRKWEEKTSGQDVL